ncbi:L,D-transpeptidase [Pseudonocardia pini]|uniref:L,D-transpeptidase n=1 Tax=Pseudonocardia pini TaxID=2758030 RepID=UPI0015F049C0|nr:L,D-transpeptidase [Pseudonocardia pini]
MRKWLVAAGALAVLALAPGTALAGPGDPAPPRCTACVDVAAKQAWLLRDGVVVRGPVAVSPGGQGKETPRGDFTVEWKNVNHRSKEFNDASMPFAVFFAQGGIGFHEGTLETPSAGCVRLTREEAIEFYDFLQVGDAVQIR